MPHAQEYWNVQEEEEFLMVLTDSAAEPPREGWELRSAILAIPVHP